MPENLDRCITATMRNSILSFLRHHIGQEYTASEISQQISLPLATPYQVASVIQHMPAWNKWHININRSQHPYKYSFV